MTRITLSRLSLLLAAAILSACKNKPATPAATPTLSVPERVSSAVDKSSGPLSGAFTNELQAQHIQQEAEDLGIESFNTNSESGDRPPLEPLSPGERDERRRQLRELARQLSLSRRRMTQAMDKSVAISGTTTTLISPPKHDEGPLP